MIYLVRHGQSEWNLARRTQGQTPHPALTPRGRADAARAAALIAADRDARRDTTVPLLVTSDLVRARQTAEIIGRRLGIRHRPDLDPRLREQALGDLEGRSTDESAAAAEGFDFADVDAHLAGGESAREVYVRMAAALAELPAAATTIVVSHGDALRYGFGWASGQRVEDCAWVSFASGAVAAAGHGAAPRWL